MAGEFGTLEGSTRRPRWPAVLIGIALFALVAGGGYVLGVRRVGQVPTPAATTEPADADSATTSASSAADDADSSSTSDSVTWYGVAKPVSPTPTFFADLSAFYSEAPGGGETAILSVFAVGELNGKRILIAALSPWTLDFRTNVPVLFLEDGTTYRLLFKHSPDMADYQDKTQYSGPTLASGVTLDTTTELSSITYKEKLTVKGTDVTARSDYPQLWSDIEAKEGATVTEFARTPAGTLYRNRVVAAPAAESPAPESLALERFVLKRPNQTAQVYQLYPSILTDDYSIPVNWDDGTATTASYRLDGMSGCGSPDSVTVWDGDIRTAKNITAAGKASDGQTVYAFTSPTDPIIAYYFSATGGKTFVESAEISFTVDDYVKNRGLIAYQDPLGRILVFMNTYYGPNAECGKPVVYLYPTEPTDVSVQVGADITKSEPTYGSGWTVRAEPDGTLITSDGQTYESLFWEGLGHGAYPPITAGFVVAQADLESTLRDHLAKLGLNAKESADFLEFWLPRMPATSYTRLTWFGTRQMAELAPLTVLPAPETSIRIFLDFAGLDQPIGLPTQHLSAPPRRGFTLVEWGGLLRK